MEIQLAKWLALLVLIVTAVLGGIAPMKLKKFDRSGRFLSLGNMFSAGIFLGGGLMHLLPEGHEGFEEVLDSIDNKTVAHYPWAFLLCGLGFFAILVTEELVLFLKDAGGDAGDQSPKTVMKRSKRVAVAPLPMDHGCCYQEVKDKEDTRLRVQETRSQEFLKLYYSRRKLARSIVEGMTPRVTLRTPDSMQTCRHSDASQTPAAMEAGDAGTLRESLLNPTDSSSDDHDHAHGAHSKDEDEHNHGHGGHDHDHMSLPPKGGAVVAYVLVLALSFHSIFEGIALGTQDELEGVISIFIAVLAHTPLAGFALGVSLVNAKANLTVFIGCIITFAVTGPLGGVAGIILSTYLEGTALTAISAGFQSFSSGTFLFVALEEIIPREMASPRDKFWKLVLAVLGFIFMAAVKIMD